MARHRRRHRRSRRGSRTLVPGLSNTTLALGAGAFLLLTQTGQSLLASFGLSAPAPNATGITGLGGTRAIGPGLGQWHGTRTLGPGLGAWGRPTLPSVGLGFFHGFRGGLGAFHQGLYPARRWWT